MNGEKKDFKSVKVNIKSGAKNAETLSRSMLYSGINIFGQLTQQYMENKEQFAVMNSSSSKTELTASLEAPSTTGGDMLNLPSDVLMIFKRVQKKDPATKCKAFRELDDYLDRIEKYSEEHSNLLTFFLYHYCRILVNEIDKKVREAAQTTLGSFIKKGGKSLGPHMSKIFPIWYCSFFDSCSEVAQLGLKNFQGAFKENGDRVFKISFKHFLHFADEHLSQSEDQMSEGNADLSKPQKEENFDRIISSILLALADSFSFTKSWDDNDRNYYLKKLLSYLDLKIREKKENQDQNQSMKQDKGKKEKDEYPKLWSFATNKYRNKVRSACLLFISKFLANFPKDITEQHTYTLAPLIFQMAAEDNSIVQSTLWKDAYFTVGKQFPEAWSLISLKKSFIPAIMDCLKNSGFGAAYALYPNMVKFVSVFPLFQLIDIKEDKNNKYTIKDRAKFMTQFFQHIYAGLKNEEASNFHRELTGAYFETLTFVLIKRFLPLAESKSFDFDDKDLSYVWDQLETIIDSPVKDFIQKYEKNKSKVQNQRNIRSTIKERYFKMIKDLIERQVNEKVVQKVIGAVFEAYSQFGSFTEQIQEINALRFAKVFAKMRLEPFADSLDYLKYINSGMNIKLIEKVFSKEIALEAKEVGRKTLDQLVVKSENLAKFVVCISKNNLGEDCFKIITLDVLLELIQSLEDTEVRNASRLDKVDLTKIQSVKLSLVTMAQVSLNRPTPQILESNQAAALHKFVSYLLLESKVIGFQTQRLIISPLENGTLKSKSLDTLNNYFLNLRSLSDITTTFISQKLISDIQNQYFLLDQLMKQAESNQFSLFSSKEQANQIAEELYTTLNSAVLNSDQVQYYFKAASHILGQSSETSCTVKTSIYGPQLVWNFQIKLIEQILITSSINRTKSSQIQQSELWDLLQNLLSKEIGVQRNGNTSLLNNFKMQLKKSLALLIQGLNDSVQARNKLVSYSQVDRIDRFTKTMRDFVQLCEPHERQQTIEFILLSEENFSNCDQNCLPMKIYRDLFLQGGIGFDIQSMLCLSEGNSYKYAWLASLLLNINNMNSLNNLPDLKRQLSLFVETEVVPALLVSVKNGHKDLLFRLMEQFRQKISDENDSCLSTLENFLHKIVLPDEDFGCGDEPLLKVDDFKQIFQILSINTAKEFLQKNTSSITQTDINLMASTLKQIAYYILDEPEVVSIIKKVKKNLHIDILTKQNNLQEVCHCIQIYLSLFKSFQTEYDPELQECLLQWIIGNFEDNFLNCEANVKQKTYQLNVILNFVASMMDHLGMNKFIAIIGRIPEDTLMTWKGEKLLADREIKTAAKILAEQSAQEMTEEAKVEEAPAEVQMEDQATLETLILRVVQISQDVELEPLTYINLLTLVRKVLPNQSIITQKQFLIDQIIEMAKEKVISFDLKLHSFVKAQEIQRIQIIKGGQELAQEDKGACETLQIVHLEDQMLQAFADTLITCTLYISDDVSENSLYVLINSGLDSLQKAAFYMLSHLYQAYIPKVIFSKDEEQELLQLQSLANEDQAGAQKEEIKEAEIQSKVNNEKQKATDAKIDKNVPQALIELIANPPNIQMDDIESSRDRHGKIEGAQLQTQVESLIFGDTKEGCLPKKVFGYLLAWSSLLKKIDNGRMKAQLAERNDYIAILGSITEYLEQNVYVYEMLLVILVAYLPAVKRLQMNPEDLQDFEPSQMDIEDQTSAKLMSLYTLVGFMKGFPSLARKYYQNCDKQLLEIVLPYIKQIASPAILGNEIQKIELSQLTLKENGQGEGLTFQLFKSTKEIIAEYSKGEVQMQLKIQIPTDYPLKSVVVELGQQLKITERQKNKWVLAIKNLLQLRNGDIISAVLLWKSNIDKELDGIEDCFICYCVLHPTDKSLPRMPCKNCKYKFHVACVRKWFKSSNKSNCPLCQQSMM